MSHFIKVTFPKSPRAAYHIPKPADLIHARLARLARLGRLTSPARPDTPGLARSD